MGPRHLRRPHCVLLWKLAVSPFESNRGGEGLSARHQASLGRLEAMLGKAAGSKGQKCSIFHVNNCLVRAGELTIDRDNNVEKCGVGTNGWTSFCLQHPAACSSCLFLAAWRNWGGAKDAPR